MAKERSALSAGIFIIVAVAVVVAIVIGISGVDTFTAKRSYVITFKITDDIGGLQRGDEVRLGGFKVGTINTIRVVEAADANSQPSLELEIAVPNRYVLRDGAQIRVQETVTGMAWLNISNVGAGAELQEGALIPGSPSSMSELLANVKEIAPEIKGVISDVRTVTLPKVNSTVDKAGEMASTFKKTGEDASGLITHVRSKVDPVADAGKGMMEQIRDLVGDTKSDIRGTMANLNASTGSLKGKLPQLLDRVDSILEQMQATVAGINEALGDIKETVANTKAVSGAARDVMVGNKGKIDGMIASLKTTSDNLKGASSEIRRSPWRLLYKPQPNEMANLNIFDSAREFSEGANDLNDAALALRDAANKPNVTEEELNKLLADLELQFTQFQAVEKELWEKVQE